MSAQPLAVTAIDRGLTPGGIPRLDGICVRVRFVSPAARATANPKAGDFYFEYHGRERLRCESRWSQTDATRIDQSFPLFFASCTTVSDTVCGLPEAHRVRERRDELCRARKDTPYLMGSKGGREYPARNACPHIWWRTSGGRYPVQSDKLKGPLPGSPRGRAFLHCGSHYERDHQPRRPHLTSVVWGLSRRGK
jgi:hypothetical protein